MIKILTILLLFTLSASAQKDTTFQTKKGDVITIKGKDTVVGFAGSFMFNRATAKFVPVKKSPTKPTKTDVFWDSVVVRRLRVTTFKNVHRYPK